MKYESTILKRLIDTYGVVGNPRYISEIIKEFIVRGKERFPELFTYQADWLAHIDEFGLNPSYTVSYTGQSIYAPNTLERPVKSAILTGQTLVNVINYNNTMISTSNKYVQFSSMIKEIIAKTITIVNDSNKSVRIQTEVNGAYNRQIVIKANSKQVVVLNADEKLTRIRGSQTDGWSIDETGLDELKRTVMIIEGDHTQEDIPYFEGMQSVKMPVLTTTGKNLIQQMTFKALSDRNISNETIKVTKGVTYTLSISSGIIKAALSLMRDNKSTPPIPTEHESVVQNLIGFSSYSVVTFTAVETGEFYLQFRGNVTGTSESLSNSNIQLEQGTVATSYEPYKTNILSCLEPVELGSVGEVKDELNLLTQQLTQRTETRPYQEGDELNSEFVTDMTNTRYKLAQEVVKTVDLTILDQNGQNVKQLMSFKGGTHFNTRSSEGSLLPLVSVSVETDLEETLKVCSLEGNTM